MKSIRKQMIVYLMLGILALFGMLFYVSNIILNDLPTQTKEKYSEIVNARAGEVNKELKGFVDQITMVSNSPVVRSMDLNQIKNYLPKILLDETHRNMTIGYPNGSAWSTALEELDILFQEQYQEIFLKGKDIMISQPFINPYSYKAKEPIVVIAHSIKDDSNRTIGLVNIAIKVDYLNNIVKKINLKGSGYSWIVNNKGFVVAHSNPKTIVSNNITDYINDDGFSTDKITDMGSGILEYENEKGERMLAFFDKIKDSPDWTFIISIAEKEIYKEIDDFKDTMVISIIIGLLLVFIFSLSYAKTLTNPIFSLEDVFNEAAKGNLNIKANENIQNELGIAAKSFNIMIDKIKHLTYKDTITDLYNYNGFLLDLPIAIEKSIEKEEEISVVIISIDDFKKINTIKGYEIGNEVLCNLADKITNFILDDEIVARFLGDEFIIFLHGKEMAILEDRICELRELCNGEIQIGEHQIILKTSIGASITTGIDVSIKDIIHQATAAKLIVKKMGGNSFKLYNFELDQSIVEEQNMEDDLYRAIENNELKLVYQPIIEVSTDKIGTTEALLRWTNPLYNKISPLVIIGKAEKSGLIFELGEWILRQACKQNKEWQNKGYSPIVVAVNVSAIQFEQTNFVEMVKEILNDIKMEPKYLELEITETNAMDCVEEKLIKMRQLKDMGVRISIDDFGTGYSSLSYFTQFPIDTLKIDRSFITDMLDDENSKTIVNTIISMAKSIQIDITAEGVENLEQLEYLKQNGCSKIQGYYFSRPIDPIMIEEMFKKEQNS